MISSFFLPPGEIKIPIGSKYLSATYQLFAPQRNQNTYQLSANTYQPYQLRFLPPDEIKIPISC